MDMVPRQKKMLKWILVPVLVALIMRFLFGVDLLGGFALMSTAFLFFLPVGIGALTVFLSEPEKAARWGYRIMAPWISIMVFFVIAFLFQMEGWPCLLMILPIFLLAGSIGGIIGGVLRARKDDNKLKVSVIVLLPLLAAPVENWIGAGDKVYHTNTQIDIAAPAERIWDNVTRVRTITPEEDHGGITKMLHFPRPVRAELNFEGVGASREAIFTDGLVFHEKVIDYADNDHMTFSITALPHEIPLTTMDEHLVVGGKYFDVLTGTYRLEKLGDNRYRLHLSSSFRLKTTFNFYASWWCDRIMRDIQGNILQVEKRRCEASDAP